MPVMRFGRMLRAAAVSAGVALAAMPVQAQECAYLGATENFNTIAYCVSSALRPSGGNSYGPAQLFDGRSDTAWCEGARGSGAGQMLSLRIDQGGPFRRIFIENGYQKSAATFERNARPRTLEIRTDTGLVFRHVLEDTDAERMIDFPEPGEYGLVQIRVIDVYPGSRYEDMCISTILVDFDYEKYLEYENQGVAPTPPPTPPSPTPQPQPQPDLPDLPDL